MQVTFGFLNRWSAVRLCPGPPSHPSQSALVNGRGWLGIGPAVVTLLPDNVFRSLLYKGGLATGWLISRVLEPQAGHPISSRTFFDLDKSDLFESLAAAC